MGLGDFNTDGRLSQTVEQFFKDANLRYFVHPEQTAYIVPMRGVHGTWQVRVLVREETSRVMINSLLFGNTPQEKRIPLMSLLTYANYGLFLGNFEMDLNDGEIGYKVSIDVEDGELTSGMLRVMFGANVITVDRYLPAIHRVLYENANPREACHAVEHPDTGSSLEDLLRGLDLPGEEEDDQEDSDRDDNRDSHDGRSG